MSAGATIPATPIAGTADPNPLVTYAQYQTVTQDSTTSSGTFAATLPEALDVVERRCNRTLLYGEYVERLYIYKDGLVYPSAIPLDQAQPATIGGAPGQGIIQGDGIWVGWFTPLPTMPVWAGVIPPQTDVTYWGGYTGATMPYRLVRLICKVCYFILFPFVASGTPALAHSINSGGVSVSGDLSQMILGDAQMRKDLDRFKRSQLHGWQS